MAEDCFCPVLCEFLCVLMMLGKREVPSTMRLPRTVSVQLKMHECVSLVLRVNEWVNYVLK